jgi:hypothetical protein
MTAQDIAASEHVLEAILDDAGLMLVPSGGSGFMLAKSANCRNNFGMTSKLALGWAIVRYLRGKRPA